MTCKGCKPPVTVGPRPYYEQVSNEVIEDHTQVFTNTKYPGAICIVNEWVVPEENGSADLIAPDLTNIAVGEYLHNSLYGYFLVAFWNPQNCTIGVINQTVAGTAQPGSVVPAGTLFIIAPKPCCENDNSTLFPFLAEDFFVPPAGISLSVNVTSTFGLRTGDIVRIADGLFDLEQIISSKEIVIHNNGAGGVPGTEIKAKNSSGEYQYLITAENTAICSAADAEEGSLLICSGSDQKVLSGRRAGQVPVLMDTAGDIVSFQYLDTQIRVCTELTESVEILPAVLDYVFTVENTDGFAPQDIIQLDIGIVRFKINSITETTLSVSSITGPPGVTSTVLPGSLVCKVLTTETILDLLEGEGGAVAAQLVVLQAQINTLTQNLALTNSNLAQEVTDRKNADIALTAAYTAAIGVVQGNLTNETLARIEDVNTEEAARIQADTDLANAIDDAVSGEADIRADADAAHDAQLASLATIGGIRVSNSVSNTANTSFTANGNTQVTTRFDELISNVSVRAMFGIFTATVTFAPTFQTVGAPKRTRMLYRLMTQMLIGAAGSTIFVGYAVDEQRAVKRTYIYDVDGNYEDGIELTITRAFLVPAGQEVRLRGEADMTAESITSGTTVVYAVGSMSLIYNSLAVKI